MTNKKSGYQKTFAHKQTVEPETEKSKSELKREMLALQDIGNELVNLPNKQLELVPLEEPLKDAILLARRLKNREGKRRQMQYIGKLMRTADTEAINTKLNFFRKDGTTYRRHIIAIEKWCNQLIEYGDTGINQLLEQHPSLDRQQLRQLVRQAKKEQENRELENKEQENRDPERTEQSHTKPPVASRKLFAYLRDAIEPK